MKEYNITPVAKPRQTKSDTSNELLVELYKKHGSVWKVGKIVGLCGQSVHERLYKLNVTRPIRNLTISEKEKIKAIYKSGIMRGDGKLKKLSEEINRTVPFMSRYAKTQGLTTYNRVCTNAYCRSVGKRSKKYFLTNPHPKGFLGGKHTKKAKKKISKKSKESWGKMTKQSKAERIVKALKSKRKNGNWNNHIKSSNAYSRTKSGKRKDLNNMFFRSAAEANYARYLKFAGVKFKYEYKTFYFEGIKRGTVSYTPDFYIPTEDKYIEFKGWLDKKSITRLRRFKKYYPAEFLKMSIIKQRLNKKIYEELYKIGFTLNQIIDFKGIEKLSKIIPHWE